MYTITDATDVSSLELVDVSGTQFRYINSLPMLATIRQFTESPNAGVRFVYGAGVGAQLVKQVVDVGQWRISDDTW